MLQLIKDKILLKKNLYKKRFIVIYTGYLKPLFQPTQLHCATTPIIQIAIAEKPVIKIYFLGLYYAADTTYINGEN